MYTYSLKQIVSFLESNAIPFNPSNIRVLDFGHNHGCNILLPPGDKIISIQTHPMIAGEAFAETAMLYSWNNDIVSDGTHGYYDVRRWDTPELLFDHILEVVGGLFKKETVDTCL